MQINNGTIHIKGKSLPFKVSTVAVADGEEGETKTVVRFELTFSSPAAAIQALADLDDGTVKKRRKRRTKAEIEAARAAAAEATKKLESVKKTETSKPKTAAAA